MTPRLADILAGCAAALLIPPASESGEAFAAARQGMVVMLLRLAAQEADRAADAAQFENEAMRALFATAAGAYDADLDGRLSSRAVGAGSTLSSLETINADLRLILIALHQKVEQRRDRALDRTILELYGVMARARRLELSPSP